MNPTKDIEEVADMPMNIVGGRFIRKRYGAWNYREVDGKRLVRFVTCVDNVWPA